MVTQYMLIILFYLFFCIVAVFLTHSLKQPISIYWGKRRNERICISNIGSCRISLWEMILLSFLLGVFAVICSPDGYKLDRKYYAARFEDGYLDQLPKAMQVVYSILRTVTADPNVLFFTVSFFCLFITLVAYRQTNGATSQTITLLVLSDYCLLSLYLIKQAPSIAIATLSIAMLLKKKYLGAIGFLLIAVFFHESALVLFPLYLILIGSERRWVRVLEYCFLGLCVIAFSFVSSHALSFVREFIPELYEEIKGFLGSDGNIVQNFNFLTAIKGFPYYFITIYGLVNRKKFIEVIKNYDKYLVLCVFASTMIILSSYMYWMWRFGVYCYFHMYIFYSFLVKHSDRKNKGLLMFVVLGSSAFLTFRYLYQIFFLYGGF